MTELGYYAWEAFLPFDYSCEKNRAFQGKRGKKGQGCIYIGEWSGSRSERLLNGVGSELISFSWTMYLGYTLRNTDGDGMG